MTERDTAIALLQVVALVLPAVAIYLQFLSNRVTLTDMDDRQAANYQAIRLTFLYLLTAGLLLIVEILWTPTWGEYLNGGALFALGMGFLTFALPVILSEPGLNTHHSITWPYTNARHHLSAIYSSYRTRSHRIEQDDVD